MKARYVIGLVALLAVAAVLWRLAAPYRPSREYDPYASTTPAAVRSAAQEVEDSLVRAGRMPTSGARLERRQGVLEWENISEGAPAVVEARVQSVRVTAGAPFLRSLLDDDPTYVAAVEARVVTADGREATLTVDLWDYGLLTPWSILPNGDGWKPLP
ncbi:MAG: hypothetical protein QME94_05545 [Anaerolineae bacterium]|nr:hypothetical protein [Anaerolineae bacterium]